MGYPYRLNSVNTEDNPCAMLETRTPGQGDRVILVFVAAGIGTGGIDCQGVADGAEIIQLGLFQGDMDEEVQCVEIDGVTPEQFGQGDLGFVGNIAGNQAHPQPRLVGRGRTR